MNEIVLRKGPHQTREDGMCANEFIAWVANERHSDHPRCVDSDVSMFMMGLNDALDDEDRQRLRPYLGRCIGTRDDGRSGARALLFQELRDRYSGRLFTLAHRAAREGGWRVIGPFLDQLLPTEALPGVAEAIQQKVGAAA